MHDTPLVTLQGVTRSFPGPVHALRDFSLDIVRGEWVAMMGPSGSGKTTLLNLLSGLDRPTAGSVFVAGQDLSALTDDGLARLRRETVGLVFQEFHLVPYLTAVENIMVAQFYHSMADEGEAAAVLTRVGLGHRLTHLPSQLSGGEQQRVCIARALVNRPPLILADEPTGNLDEENEAIVLDLFRSLHREGHTIVMVTHDPEVGRLADRQVHLAHGRVAGTYLMDPYAEDRVDETLRRIWILRERGDLSTAAVAATREGSDAGLLQHLAGQGFLRVDPDRVAFEPAGEGRARDIVRRHRLAERLFTQSFRMADPDSETEACQFEHILSREMTDRICTFLQHPRSCPHGKPIPPGPCCASAMPPN